MPQIQGPSVLAHLKLAGTGKDRRVPARKKEEWIRDGKRGGWEKGLGGEERRRENCDQVGGNLTN